MRNIGNALSACMLIYLQCRNYNGSTLDLATKREMPRRPICRGISLLVAGSNVNHCSFYIVSISTYRPRERYSISRMRSSR